MEFVRICPCAPPDLSCLYIPIWAIKGHCNYWTWKRLGLAGWTGYCIIGVHKVISFCISNDPITHHIWVVKLALISSIYIDKRVQFPISYSALDSICNFRCWLSNGTAIRLRLEREWGIKMWRFLENGQTFCLHFYPDRRVESSSDVTLNSSSRCFVNGETICEAYSNLCDAVRIACASIREFPLLCS